MAQSSTILVPDAGPLITLAYAERLDLLQVLGWPVHIVDMVLYEVTRNSTPTSQAIADFIASQELTIISSSVHRAYQQRLSEARRGSLPRKVGLGELAIQEYMIRLDTESPQVSSVFLFEDHKIAQSSFHLPERAHRVSTRAFLMFLEEKGKLESAADIERAAITKGRHFSRLRFPP